MKAQILSLLRERADYVSGQELCEHFGVSRTAVWKAVGQLKKEGYVIEAVQNRGYRLLEGTEPYREEVYGQNELVSRMHTAWAGRELHFYESLGSTNVQAKQLAESGAAHGALVVADMQTAGRGRRGRGWVSPAGANIYFTIVLRP
ncbi:MAG: biotin operon repressor, partial [Acetatifactor sp.]